MTEKFDPGIQNFKVFQVIKPVSKQGNDLRTCGNVIYGSTPDTTRMIMHLGIWIKTLQPAVYYDLLYQAFAGHYFQISVYRGKADVWKLAPDHFMQFGSGRVAWHTPHFLDNDPALTGNPETFFRLHIFLALF
jgi:hypothetical protein